jgi:hypothetical protein
MAGLRERLRRLEEKGAKPVDLMCPECKAVIRVYDERVLRLEFLTYLWAPKRRREENGQEPSAEVLWLADHEHDPSAFVNKATGEPWLGEFFHGTSQMWLEEAEDKRRTSLSSVVELLTFLFAAFVVMFIVGAKNGPFRPIH